jgi:hypothetical protein
MSVDPLRSQFEVFKKLPRDEPIHMLNLIKYKKSATYPHGHPLAGQNLSGKEAYATYKKKTYVFGQKLKMREVYRGKPQVRTKKERFVCFSVNFLG